MKSRYCLLPFICIIMLAAFCSEKAMSADITDIGPSAKPIAMGRAYSAVEDSVDCILFNPAGLAGIDSLRLSSMYSNVSNDFSYTNLAVALPVKYGVIGFAMLNEQSGMLYRTALDSDGRVIADGSPFNFTNQVYALSFSKQFDKRFAAGARLKLYEKEGSMVENGHGTGTSLDIGLLYKLDPRTNIGLYHENLLSSGISWRTGTRDPLPPRTRAGIMFRAAQEWTFVMDAIMSGNDPLSFRAGAEWQAYGLLFLRAGLEQANIGSEKYFNYSLGAGSNFKTFYINYAYTADTMLKANSSHFVSIGLEIPSFCKATAEAAPGITQEANKPEPQQVHAGNKLKKEELAVRAQINAIDKKISKARAKRDTKKIRALQKEKADILKRWEETKKARINGTLPVVKENTREVPEKKSAMTKPEPGQAADMAQNKDLTEDILKKEGISVKARVSALDEKINKARTKKDTKSISALQKEKAGILNRWEDMKRSPANPLGSEIKRAD